MSNTKLPALPPHPAIRDGITWRDDERKAIDEYARAAILADRERQAGEAVGWHEAVMKEAEELDMEWLVVAGIFERLLPSFMADKNAAGFVTIPYTSLIEHDDYGVYGSTFYRCKACGAESGAGVLNKGIEHGSDCPLASLPAPQAVQAEEEGRYRLAPPEYQTPEYHASVLEAVRAGRVTYAPGWNEPPSPDGKAEQAEARDCTCHPDDNPPVPCAKKYALNECLATKPTASNAGEQA